MLLYEYTFRYLIDKSYIRCYVLAKSYGSKELCSQNPTVAEIGGAKILLYPNTLFDLSATVADYTA